MNRERERVGLRRLLKDGNSIKTGHEQLSAQQLPSLVEQSAADAFDKHLGINQIHRKLPDRVIRQIASESPAIGNYIHKDMAVLFIHGSHMAFDFDQLAVFPA